MPASKAQQKAQNKWIAKAYDRINLTVAKGQKEAIQAHAETKGESVNRFIGRAIDETMERDAGTPTEAASLPLASGILLQSDMLEEAQSAARITGETISEFIARAVRAQAKRDETTRRMGLDPVTGGRPTRR